MRLGLGKRSKVAMNYNYLLLILPAAMLGIMIFCLYDLTTREFPTRNLKQLYAILIVFPPIIGFILYYLIVIKANKYKKKYV